MSRVELTNIVIRKLEYEQSRTNKQNKILEYEQSRTKKQTKIKNKFSNPSKAKDIIDRIPFSSTKTWYLTSA